MVDGVAVGPCGVGGPAYIVTLWPGAVAELEEAVLWDRGSSCLDGSTSSGIAQSTLLGA